MAAACSPLGRCAETAGVPDYALAENWAYFADGEELAADVFFICPTVYRPDGQAFNMPMDDQEARASFLGATNMEKGIYDESACFYAPYYRQAGLNVYALPEEEREPWLALAYEDVKAAFIYYLENCNDGRPLVLAGFSQGADMCIRLMKDCFADEATSGPAGGLLCHRLADYGGGIDGSIPICAWRRARTTRA